MAPLLAALALLLAVDVPKNDGWVTDLADLLKPAEEQALEALMESYKAGSTHEIALLTVPDLDGRPIEELALETGRAWGIGGREQNNGALVVIAVAERKVRIETGRGLEGPLPDAICGRIIRNVITPEFKAGRYPSGIRKGVEAIHSAIGGDYGPIDNTPAGKKSKSRGLGFIPIVAIVLLASMARRRRGMLRSSRGSDWFWPAFWISTMSDHGRGSGSSHFGGFGGGDSGGGGGFSGFGGGGGFSGGGSTGGW